MPTDKLDIQNAFMIDPNTGDRIKLDGIKEMTVEAVEPIDIEPIKTGGEIEISMDVDISDELKEMLMPKTLVLKDIYNTGDLLRKLHIAKWILEDAPINANILQAIVRQAKTHKKKRINKKWAKRYGHTCIVFYV